ncbi:TetR/AcrR family transcriptional regulator [Microbacterium sp. NPDC091313]
MKAPAATPRREATRQRLLDAAAEVFAEVGLDATSVEAVCERAGFTRGAFYSNFDTKEQLFLELAARVSASRVADVEARVAELAVPPAGGSPVDALALVEQVLDLPGDDRLDVLLFSEIRIHALRDPAIARPFLAQDADIAAAIERLIGDIAARTGLGLTVSAEQAARMLLLTWEGEMTRAVMAGLDRAAAQDRVKAAIGRLVPLLTG